MGWAEEEEEEEGEEIQEDLSRVRNPEMESRRNKKRMPAFKDSDSDEAGDDVVLVSAGQPMVAPRASDALQEVKVEVPAGTLPERIDKFLLTCAGDLKLSRSAINKLFQDNAISINGSGCKKGNKVELFVLAG